MMQDEFDVEALPGRRAHLPLRVARLLLVFALLVVAFAVGYLARSAPSVLTAPASASPSPTPALVFVEHNAVPFAVRWIDVAPGRYVAVGWGTIPSATVDVATTVADAQGHALLLEPHAAAGRPDIDGTFRYTFSYEWAYGPVIPAGAVALDVSARASVPGRDDGLSDLQISLPH